MTAPRAGSKRSGRYWTPSWFHRVDELEARLKAAETAKPLGRSEVEMGRSEVETIAMAREWNPCMRLSLAEQWSLAGTAKKRERRAEARAFLRALRGKP